MRRKIFSIFGIAAIVAFFLPWLKTCDKVETGFELLILNSLKNFAGSSLSSLNTGLLFLLVPLYTIMVAWLLTENTKAKPFKIFFGFLSALSMWNIGIWGGLEISALSQEWGTEQHLHAIKMAKLVGIEIISAIALVLFLFKWAKTKQFNFGWSCSVLIFPLFAAIGVGFTIEPHYYGIWLYLFSMICLFVGSVWDGIAGLKSG